MSHILLTPLGFAMIPNAHVLICDIDADHELMVVRMRLAFITHSKLHDEDNSTSLSSLVE